MSYVYSVLHAVHKSRKLIFYGYIISKNRVISHIDLFTISTMNAIQTAIAASLTDGTLAAFIAKALGDSKQKTKINKAIKEFLAGDAEEKPAKPAKGKKPAKEEPKSKGKAKKPAKTDTEDEEVPLEKKTVKELKEMCKEKGLATTGKKEELIERLGESAAPVEDDAVETPTDFKKMKVPELKALCKERGLDDKGKKDELIERLEAANASDSDKEDEGSDGEKDDSAPEKEEEQEDDE